MRWVLAIFGGSILVAAAGYVFFFGQPTSPPQQILQFRSVNTPIVNTNTPVPPTTGNTNSTTDTDSIPAVGDVNTETNAAPVPTAALTQPLSDSRARVTKKPFGIYITPATSPVQPEQFSGYHSGVDFEIADSESDAEVVAAAVCDGTVRVKRRVSGYGGVFIHSCVIDGAEVTVLYGHLQLASIGFAVGQTIHAGDRIGLLGDGYSEDTDGERKHLHLGIHRGTSIEYRGYVGSESQLSDWLDALEYLP